MEIEYKKVVPLAENKYLNLYDIQYNQDRHYMVASRRKETDLVALKSDDDFKNALPDAVTLCVILRMKDADRLLLFYEFRYPAGHFLLSPPAGIIDPEDKSSDDAIYKAAVRELYEETGLVFSDNDQFRILNSGLFSSPGMTDEMNAVVLLVLNDPDTSALTDRHSEETEMFNGFCLTDREEALEYIKTGRDRYGNMYSVYTWQDLLYFVSDIWK